MRYIFRATLAFAFGAVLASAATLTQVQNFGANPSGIQMHLYVPDKVATNPGLIVAIHGCTGSASGYFRETTLPQEADSRGFILIYPSTTKDSNCWDSATNKSLTHEGGGDSTGIASMVKYAIEKHGIDKNKIFVTGTSSGGMMTNVLAATYPDIFAAGAVFSGVAAGCLAGSPSSSPQRADPNCFSGKVVKTAEEWGAFVKNAYPAWSSSTNATWPRMQIWHGKADTFISYLNLAEMLKQWSNIHGVSFSKNVTNTPLNQYTEIVYGDGSKVVAYSVEGVGHVVPTHTTSVLKFFGL